MSKFTIQTASQNNNLALVKFLLKNGADPTIGDNFPLKIASYQGYSEIVKVLLDDGRVNPCVECNIPLRFACQNGHTEVVRLLLETELLDPSSNGDYAIKIAAFNGNIAITKLLLEDRRVNPLGALSFACESGVTGVVETLLDDPRIGGNNLEVSECIILACRFGNTKALAQLLCYATLTRQTSENAICIASAKGYANCVRLLIYHGVKPCCRDNFPLRIASQLGNAEVVKLLLEDPTVHPDARCNFALRLASENGHTKVVKMLLEDNRVRIDAFNNYALEKATLHGHTQIVQLLSSRCTMISV